LKVVIVTLHTLSSPCLTSVTQLARFIGWGVWSCQKQGLRKPIADPYSVTQGVLGGRHMWGAGEGLKGRWWVLFGVVFANGRKYYCGRHV